MTKINFQNIKKVYYHANCSDGMIAASIIKKAYLDANIIPPEFFPFQYDDSVEPEHGQLFVDITPPKDKYKAWFPFNPVILDHHETVKHIIEELGGVYRTNEAHSGAMMAYEEVYVPLNGENETVKWLATRAMIRDTWKITDPLWKEACEIDQSMNFAGPKFLDYIEDIVPDYFWEIGQHLYRNVESKVKKYVHSSAHYTTSNGYKISHYNCTEKLTSEVGHALLDSGSDLGIGWFVLNKPTGLKTIFSLRSNNRISARKIAESFGGGGHEKAAGFSVVGVDPHHIVNTIIKSIELFEDSYIGI